MINTETTDIEEYLQARNIAYDPPGSKNVGRESVGISCPFCGDHSDTGDNHLGIKIDTKQWNCWICGAGKNKGFLSLVVKLEDCSYRQAEEILKPFTHSDMSLLQTTPDMPLRASQGYFQLPSEAKDELLEPHRKYLESRGFDADFLHRKYNLKCVGPISKRWKLTIIAPVYFHYRMVAWTAADITRKRDNKYKNALIEEVLIPVNHTIYNVDTTQHTILVVEGLTDVWNIGDGAVGLYTKHATRQQLKILSEFDRVFIMLDPDASETTILDKLPPADQLASDLSAFTNTEIIELDYGDPGEMKQDDVKHLRREIFGS